MKRNEHLRPLSLNHYDGLIAARRLQKGLDNNADTAVMCEYAMELWETQLKPHCLREEEHLIPELDRLFATAMKDRLLGDHQEIQTLVYRIKRGDNPQFHLSKLSSLLNRHIRFEERKLFPFLERQLGDERLGRIGQYLNEHHSNADHNWSPPFWD